MGARRVNLVGRFLVSPIGQIQASPERSEGKTGNFCYDRILLQYSKHRLTSLSES